MIFVCIFYYPSVKWLDAGAILVSNQLAKRPCLIGLTPNFLLALPILILSKNQPPTHPFPPSHLNFKLPNLTVTFQNH